MFGPLQIVGFLFRNFIAFTVTVETYYATEFANMIMMLVQQKGSKLQGTVMEKSHKGSVAQPVTQVGKVEMQPIIGRFQPMGRVDAPSDARWVYPNPMELPQLVDPNDELQMIIDPKSKYAENARAAAGRQIDREIINGALGNNQTS